MQFCQAYLLLLYIITFRINSDAHCIHWSHFVVSFLIVLQQLSLAPVWLFLNEI